MAEAEPGAGQGAGPLPDDARAVLAAARDAAAAHVGALQALRRLFAAEVGLAKAALVQALVFLLLAMVMLGTAYGLLTALLVAGLRSAGAPWPLAIAIPLLLSLVLCGLAAWRARAVLRHADFEGTRRQIAKGLGGGDSVAEDEGGPA